MKYKVVTDSDGTINRYPILTDEEKEERHQEFLKVAHGIIEKYKNKNRKEEK